MFVMRLTSIAVTDFLALPRLSLEFDTNLTVITGANGVGKSTLLAACSLAKQAVACAVNGDAEPLDSDWADACRDGGTAFSVRIGLTFDRADERTLLDQYLVAALLPLLHAVSERADETDEVLRQVLGASPADALSRGTLVVRFDAMHRYRWLVGWEFELAQGTAHLGLLGPTAGELVNGVVRYERSGPRLAELTASTNDVLERLRAGRVAVRLDDVVPSQALDFRVQPTGGRREPPSIQAVLSATGDVRNHRGEVILFARLFDALFAKRLLVTPNHRECPRSTFHPEELIGAPNLADGSMLAVELHRLKNGDANERDQFLRVQERLILLTGQKVDCRQVTTADQHGTAPTVHLTPVLEAGSSDRGIFDVPLERAGAGVVEALYLSVVLAEDRHVVLLDEPAVHLSPTAQRRLLTFLRSQGSSGQVVMVTHNPDVVPVRDAEDLKAIVRLSRRAGQVRAERLPEQMLKQPDRAIQLLASPQLRSVLFAAGVVLCEGATDLELLRSWTARGLTSSRGEVLRTSEDLNIAFFSVDGQTAFAPALRLLRSIGVPWAVVADGPALRPDRQLARYFGEEQLATLPTAERLDDVRQAWADAGVLTLASEFGDDETKSGEIEAFLETVDAEALEATQKLVGAKKGGRVGAAFAAEVDPPVLVADLWADICHRLVDLDGV